MERLRELVGQERAPEEVSRELYFAARDLRSPAVGALHITCADETELECIQAFQQGFVQYLLPQLKFGHQGPLHLANLGGRYEWGAVRMAEDHFATPESRRDHKLLVVKVNSHVAVDESLGGERFGMLKRYNSDSPCCGALHALLEGREVPFVRYLRECLLTENAERIDVLRNDAKVDPDHRSLFAALVAARCQARRVILDIQDYQPVSPTYYVVVPCITVNRAGRDSEIVCGFYTADHRLRKRREEYCGLGDDPAAYRLTREHGRIRVEDDHIDKPRAARDHRELVFHRWRERGGGSLPEDGRLRQLCDEARRHRHRDHRHVRKLLKSALLLLGEIAPGPAAVLLFAQGVAGIHHAYRAHRLADEVARSEDARRILDEIHEKVDRMEPERAQAIVELLARDYDVS